MIPVSARLAPGAGSHVDSFALYGHEVKRRAGYPEYMSATALAKMARRDKMKYNSWFNAIIQMVKRPADEKDKKDKYSYFSNGTEGTKKFLKNYGTL